MTLWLPSGSIEKADSFTVYVQFLESAKSAVRFKVSIRFPLLNMVTSISTELPGATSKLDAPMKSILWSGATCTLHSLVDNIEPLYDAVILKPWFTSALARALALA